MFIYMFSTGTKKCNNSLNGRKFINIIHTEAIFILFHLTGQCKLINIYACCRKIRHSDVKVIQVFNVYLNCNNQCCNLRYLQQTESIPKG